MCPVLISDRYLALSILVISVQSRYVMPQYTPNERIWLYNSTTGATGMAGMVNVPLWLMRGETFKSTSKRSHKFWYWALYSITFSARSGFYCFIWYGIQRGVCKTYWKLSMSQFLLCDCTFKKQCTVPVTLTSDGQFFWANWLRPYMCPVLISDRYLSTNSREIKYRTLGIDIYAFYMLSVTHVENGVK